MKHSITPATPVAKITMTSLELVEFINSQRGEEAPVLAHSDFLKKVPRVLGEKDAGNFSFIYTDSMNRKKPCYSFPKREACLMAMAYSYELQAKVFDRMTEMEEKLTTPVVKDLRTQALIENLIRLDAVEQEQQRQANEVAKLQETVAVIEARSQPENKHFTVMGYGNRIGIPMDSRTASTLGRKCANRSRERGLIIGDVSDPRFGKVHSYHESILQEVFASTAEVTRHAN